MRATQEITYKYFLGAQHEQDLKRIFRELAKTLHPDRGGSHDDFVAMKAEFDYAMAHNCYPIAPKYKTAYDPYFDIRTASNEMGDIFNRYKEARQRETAKQRAEAYAEKERKASIDPKEIQRKRAIKYFNELRATDKTFDVIDHIIDTCYRLGSDPDFRWVAIYREISKMDYLEVAHFKYFAFKMDKGAFVGINMYQQYLKNKL